MMQAHQSARDQPDGAFRSVRLINRRFSGDLQDGLEAECLEALLCGEQPHLDAWSVDPVRMPGRHGFVSKASLLLSESHAIVLCGRLLFGTASQPIYRRLCALLAKMVDIQLPVCIHGVELTPSFSLHHHAHLLEHLGRLNVISVSATDDVSRRWWNRHCSTICRCEAHITTPALLLASRVYPFRPEFWQGARPRALIGLSSTPTWPLRGKQDSQSTVEFFDRLTRKLIEIGATPILLSDGSPLDVALLSKLTKRLDDQLSTGRLQIVSPKTPRELCAALACVGVVIGRPSFVLHVATSYGKRVLVLKEEALLTPPNWTASLAVRGGDDQPIDDAGMVRILLTLLGPDRAHLRFHPDETRAMEGIQRLKHVLHGAIDRRLQLETQEFKRVKQLIVNGRFLSRRLTGVDRVAEEILRALDDLLIWHPALDGRLIKVLVPDDARSLPLRHIQFEHLPGKASTWWEQVRLRRAVKSDCLLNLCNSGPICRAQQLVVIHDTATVRCPQSYTWAFRTWYRVMAPLLYGPSAAMATVSRFARDELSSVHGFRPDVRVLSEGANHMDRTPPDEHILTRHGLQARPFVLTVGSQAAHKNLSVVVKAMSLLGPPPFDLVVAGGVDRRIFDNGEMAWPSWAKCVGYVSDAELHALYQHALCLAFPSIYEGFGLPPLEAMRVGCPVLSSLTASMPEILRDGALYFDPRDPQALAHGLMAIYERPTLRQLLIERGRIIADGKRWDAVALQLLQWLDRCCASVRDTKKSGLNVPTGEATDVRHIASFDIFETVIIRPYLQPQDLHEAVFHRADFPRVHGLQASQWRTARIQAETHARLHGSGHEVTIDQIYTQLQRILPLTEADLQSSMQAELAQESLVCSPVAKMVARLDRVRQQAGTQVCFLSDMYMPQERIANLLRSHQLLKPDDLLLVSSALGRTKSQGGLFQYLLGTLKVPPRRVCHVGDNPHADVKVPRALGIRSEHVVMTDLNRYESSFPSSASEHQLVRSAILGASRAARLAASPDDARAATICEVSASVAGPLLLGFVLWAMSSAQRMGIRHLAFLARDGQVLQRMAGIVQAQLASPVTSSYLLASRKALFLPSLDLARSESRDILCQMMVGRSLSEAAYFLDIDVGDLQACATHAVGMALDAGHIMTRDEASPMAKALKSLPVGAMIQAKATMQRKALIDYLDRLLPKDGPFGIVDVGWRGNLQTYLSRVRQYAGLANPGLTGFYFGLTRSPSPEAGSALTYVPKVERTQPELIELMCSAEHGTTLAYGYDVSGQANGVLSEPYDQQALHWGLRLQQASIVSFATLLCRALPPAVLMSGHTIDALRRHGLHSLEMLRLTPSAAEAKVYGSFLHSEDCLHRSFVELAPKHSAARTLSSRIMPALIPRPPTYWEQASMMRTLGAGPFEHLIAQFLAWRGRDQIDLATSRESLAPLEA